MTEIVHIPLKRTIDDSYDLVIGRSLFSEIAEYVSSKGYKDVVIITDSVVKDLHADSLLGFLKQAGISAFIVAFSPGESSKTRSTKEKIEDFLLENNLRRDGLVIALGGGVVGDIAGFVASTYMRGIPFIQVPTTLLAMVDSSIGGKTGVDTRLGKNLIGSFYQPRIVFIDVSLLDTLPGEELLNGIAEMIKSAVVMDKEFFSFLKYNLAAILNLDEQVTITAIKKSCEIKKEFVMKDEKDLGLRKSLNFGHTIGHAIEKTAGYDIKHGLAVLYGIIIETRIAMELKMISLADGKEIISVAKELTEGFPKLKKEKIVEATRMDKKNSDGNVLYVLPRKIGHVDYDMAVADKIVAKALGEYF